MKLIIHVNWPRAWLYVVLASFPVSLITSRKIPFGKDLGAIENFQKNRTSTCSASYGSERKSRSDINMLEVYEKLPFKNPFGGAWTQGFPIEIKEEKFTEENKLKVFVIPHSHCDPGWLRTYEDYYNSSVLHILDQMMENFQRDPELKLIWAEISFFSLWWNKLSEDQRNLVKQFVSRGQLEFVTGGWVMPDEANTHYFSLLTQLREGHQWLYHHLNYLPKNGWSIDPFGMSPTVAYINRRSGLNQMVIQRTHYAVKRHLAERRDLEFRWRQIWDSEDTTDILCHMMPFYHYDIPYTCGPDPNVCCAYDFRRLPDVSKVRCAFNQPTRITKKNAAHLSQKLLDQYKKKSMLFKTNAVLIPLGEDFYWDDDKEWKANIDNYKKIFNYINSDMNLHTEIKFGTLADYFNAVNNEISSNRFDPSVLTGDFYTYADMVQDYWSGYFTSRPFFKGMDRDLISHLRSANILFSIMYAETAAVDSFATIREDLLGHLVVARRHLSLFQHHDGITGTAKDHVMVDYGKKLLDGLRRTSLVMQHSIYILTHLENLDFGGAKISATSQFFEEAYARQEYDQLPQYKVLQVGDNVPFQFITVFNPVAQRRTQLINLYVSSDRVEVVDLYGGKLEYEILPVFEGRTIAKHKFILSILVDMDGLAIKNMKIVYAPVMIRIPPKIRVNYELEQKTPSFPVLTFLDNRTLTRLYIQNDQLTVNFGHDGFAETVRTHNTFNLHQFKIGMFSYQSQSGLYLFRPKGLNNLETSGAMIRTVKGKFQSYVEVVLPQVTHRTTLYKHSGLDQHSIEITNRVDIRKEMNFELMMRLKTGIDSKDIFHTDLNGFQMIRRKSFTQKLPLQANYYPMTSAAFIEDKNTRMTVLSKQSQGVASLLSGNLEFILDRRFQGDDQRGVGQGCMDNKETLSTFKILFESFHCTDQLAEQKPVMLSLQSHLTLNSLQYPMQVFSSINTDENDHNLDNDYGLIISPERIPCDVQLVDLAALPALSSDSDSETFTTSAQAGLYLHRVGFDGRLSESIAITECATDSGTLGQFRLRDLTGALFQSKFQQVTLTFTKEAGIWTSNNSIPLSANEIYAFTLLF